MLLANDVKLIGHRAGHGPGRGSTRRAGSPGRPGGTTRVHSTGGRNGRRNEISSSGLNGVARYRPVRRASQIAASAAAPWRERRDGAARGDREDRGASTSRRAQALPVDHFERFWPKHLDLVSAHQIKCYTAAYSNPDPSPKEPRSGWPAEAGASDLLTRSG